MNDLFRKSFGQLLNGVPELLKTAALHKYAACVDNNCYPVSSSIVETRFGLLTQELVPKLLIIPTNRGRVLFLHDCVPDLDSHVRIATVAILTLKSVDAAEIIVEDLLPERVVHVLPTSGLFVARVLLALPGRFEKYFLAPADPLLILM